MVELINGYRKGVYGSCPEPDCEWEMLADGYARFVKGYQDHLREEHPTQWMRK